MGTSCHHTQSDHPPSQNMWYFKTTGQYKLMMLSLHKPDPRKHSPKHHSDISATNVLAGHGLPECLRAFRLAFLRIKFVMNLPVSGLCHDESYTERSSGKSRDREILLPEYTYVHFVGIGLALGAHQKLFNQQFWRKHWRKQWSNCSSGLAITLEQDTCAAAVSQILCPTNNKHEHI